MLISAWTFSAGDISLALVKDHGGRKVTVIGEPAGDRVRIWAEGSHITLPHSELDIGFATGYEDYSKPCWGREHCFWTTLFFPTHVASFDPDIRVPYTFADYEHLRDPLLDKAMSLASDSTSPWGAQSIGHPVSFSAKEKSRSLHSGRDDCRGNSLK